MAEVALEAGSFCVCSKTADLTATARAQVVLALSYCGVVSASATANVPTGCTLTSPTGYATAYGGATATLTSPQWSLVASGTVPGVGRATLTSPLGVVSASGLVGGHIVATPAHGGRYVVRAFTGAYARLVHRGRYVLNGLSTTGGIGYAALELQERYVVTSTVTTGGLARASLTGYALRPTQQGGAALFAPRGYVVSGASLDVSTTYEGYVVNLNTAAVSEYTNYPFDNVIRLGNTFLGIAPNGVFSLGGDTDLLDPIECYAKTFHTNFDDPNFKRLPYVYASGRADGGVIIEVQADEGDTYSYESDWGEVPGSTNHRAVVGKGIRGVYYSIGIRNVDGCSLELDGLDAHVTTTQRGV